MNGIAIDSNRARELYDRGLTDKDIAARLGRCVETVSRWRIRSGLSPNKKTAHDSYVAPLVRDAIEAKKLGLSYGAYKAKQFEERRRGRRCS